MRIVLLLCASFTLSIATEEKLNAELLAPMSGKPETEEDVPVVEAGEKALGDMRPSRNSCPAGWDKYGSRCFLFLHREMTWIDAEKYCLRSGANLASIHSPGEYEFIQEVVRGRTGRFSRAWIGGTDAVRDRAWFWSDGSRFGFQLWGLNEPNNLEGIEKCLEINRSEDLLWNDLSCELLLPFVCGTRP